MNFAPRGALAQQHTAPLECAADLLRDLLHQGLQLLGAWRGQGLKAQQCPASVRPVEKQHVKVDVEIESAAETLNEGDRAGVRAAVGEARLADEMSGDAAVDDTEHARERARVAGEQKAQREGQAQHPLAQGLVLRQHLLDEQRGTLGHAPRAAARAEAAALAAEGDESLSLAALATHAQKAVLESPAFEVLLEFALHVRRKRALFGDALPLSEGVAGRLAAKVVWSDRGWQESISRPGDTLGALEDVALRGLLNVGLGDTASLLLNFHYNRDESENIAPTAYEGTIAGLPASQPLPTALDATPFFSVGDPQAADWSDSFRPMRNNTQNGASARLSWDLTDSVNLTSVTAYDKFDRTERYELSGVPFEDGLTNNGTDMEVFSQELRLSGGGESELYWVVGANYARDELSEIYEMFFRDSFFGFALGINAINTLYSQNTDSTAGFGHLEWNFADRLKLSLGARFTSEDREWSGCTFDDGDGSLAGAWNNILTPFTILANGLPDPGLMGPGDCGIYNDIAGTPTFGQFGIFSDEISTDKWMWKATLDFAPNEDVLLYGTVSTGFKSGGFNGASAQTHSQLLPYDAETLTSYELGLKSTLLFRRMQLNTSVFYYDYKDKREPTVAVTPVGNIAGLTNVPESEVYGAEVELRWLVTKGLSFDLGIAYLQTEIKEYQAIDANASSWPAVVTFDASGFSLANSPEWQGNATATYTWELSDRLNLFVATDVAYKADNSGSTQDPVSDYTLVNARLGVSDADERWSATVWSRNVFDEYYWNAAFASNGTFVRMNGMPATYGITLAYSFWASPRHGSQQTFSDR